MALDVLRKIEGVSDRDGAPVRQRMSRCSFTLSPPEGGPQIRRALSKLRWLRL